MTDVQQRAAAKKFAAYWKNRGDEKQETQRFWIDLLQRLSTTTSRGRHPPMNSGQKLNEPRRPYWMPETSIRIAVLPISTMK